MLSAFQLENNRLTRLEVEESQPLVNAVWIDLVEPDDDERLRVQSELGQSLATRPELEDIEASARFFEDDDGLHIHSFFFFEDAEDHAGNSTVAFTIRDGRLFTLRERELPAFRLYRMRARSQSMVDGNAYELLLDLFETKIEQLADEIENIDINDDIKTFLQENKDLFIGAIGDEISEEEIDQAIDEAISETDFNQVYRDAVKSVQNDMDQDVQTVLDVYNYITSQEFLCNNRFNT